MNPEPNRAKTVFLNALEIAAGAERDAYVHAQCGDDEALRRDVEELLRHHAAQGAFLEAPAGPPTATAAEPSRERAGAVIGPYKLVEPIGEGGMGTVWMAQQQEPVKRLVAIKLIKAGMDSAQVIARFEAERQALALMDHPNIARVLDGGTTDAGRPYFVMDLVKGVPITKYCDEHRLTPRQRLKLFLPVCQAVQHAHQKGIIHRDLKPSNVLVALYDGRPVPKVIDFGVAKAAGQSLTDKTLVTGFGNIVGTLEYMSPEQAEINQLDIDTRSDVYSLGVLLYELLAGSPPFTKENLAKAGMLEMLRVIREQEPSKPSMKLSSSDALPTLAANRGTEPAKLTKVVRGELDWIVMKALEKDRNRRYETANGFAMDVQRYLVDEPVQAGPPSTWYRLRKFLRRNKRPALAVSLVLLALVGGIVGTSLGLVQAETQRDKAVAAQEAEAKRAEGERQERRYAKAITDFLMFDFLALTSVEGQYWIGGTNEARLDKDATLRQLLDRAASKLNRRNDLDPRTEADLRGMIGESYRVLGEARLAVPFLERCVALRKELFGPDHRHTLSAQNSLAAAYDDAGWLDRSVPLYEETLKLTEATLGANDPETLKSMANLAKAYHGAGKLDLAVPLYEEALGLLKANLGENDLHTLHAMKNLAMAYRATGKLDRALPLLEQTLKLMRATLDTDHPQTLDTMRLLADGYRTADKLDLALPLLEETLKRTNVKLGPNHPDTLRSMGALAEGYRASGRLDLALPLYESTLKLTKERFGDDNLITLITMNNLALVYRAAGKLDRALPLLEETLKLRKAKLSADHPQTLNSMANLALAYQDDGKPELALPLFQEAAAGIEKRRYQHEYAGPIIINLIECHEQLKQFDQAEVWQRKWLAVVKERSGDDSVSYAGELVGLGSILLNQKKPADAEVVLRNCLAIRTQKQPNDWTTFNTQSLLGGALLGQKKYAEAEPLLLAGFDGLKQRESVIPAKGKVRVTDALERIVQLYDAWEKPDKAAEWRKRLEAQKKESGVRNQESEKKP